MDEKQMQQISRIFYEMPYMGGSIGRMNTGNSEEFVKGLIFNLETLRDTLQYIAEKQATEQAELMEYRDLLRNARKLFTLISDK